MKKYQTSFVLLLIVAFTSCSKNNSNTSIAATPTPTPIIPTPISRLVKNTIFFLNGGAEVNIDSFAYDNQRRLTYYSMSVRFRSQSNIPGLFADYNFTYSGTNTFPDSYNYRYASDSTIKSNTNLATLTQRFYFDSQNRVLMDSTISYNSWGFNNAKTNYFYYGSDYMASKQIFSNPNGTSNTMDTSYFDKSGNTVIAVHGTLDNTNNYTHTITKTYAYATIQNPFTASNTIQVLSLLRQFVNSKFLQASSVTTTYVAGNSSNSTTESDQWAADANGVVLSGSLFDVAFGNTTEQFYYY